MIRPVELRDLVQILEIEDDCFAAARGDAWDLQTYVEWLESKRAHGFVVEVNGTRDLIDGFVGLDVSRVGSIMEIITLGVRADSRREGLGRKLLKAALGYGMIREVEKVHLHVAADNVGAIALYTSLGFAETRKDLDYYKDGRDAIVMERAL